MRPYYVNCMSGWTFFVALSRAALFFLDMITRLFIISVVSEGFLASTVVNTSHGVEIGRHLDNEPIVTEEWNIKFCSQCL